MYLKRNAFQKKAKTDCNNHLNLIEHKRQVPVFNFVSLVNEKKNKNYKNWSFFVSFVMVFFLVNGNHLTSQKINGSNNIKCTCEK